MSKTNIGLVTHAEKALKEKWYYGWGSYGQKATTALVNVLVSQYACMNTRWKAYMMGAVTQGTRLCDCYGLVKSYLWWTDDNGNPKYNGAQDKNTAMAYNAAKERGAIATLPEVPGVILYMNGHVGVYCGGGRFIELMGGGVGAYEGKVANGVITKGSKFTHWFKDVNIEYLEETPNESPMLDIMINGAKYAVEFINQDGYNYIKLQSLRQAGVDVSFDAQLNMPVLKW